MLLFFFKKEEEEEEGAIVPAQFLSFLMSANRII
jgi:hypothetical protein